MLGICSQVKGICRIEEVDCIVLYDSFSNNKNLFGRDGLDINRIGTLRLGRVLDENIKQVFCKTKLRVGSGQLRSLRPRGSGQV